MAKGNGHGELKPAENAPSSSDAAAASTSTPSSFVVTENFNVDVKFAKTDNKSNYETEINQKETETASNKSHNTKAEYTGTSDGATFKMVLNIGGKPGEK